MLMTVPDLIPAELADTVERLENWGRWAIERPKRGKASSAEGNYRPRMGNNMTEEDERELARRGGTPAIDPWDALLVGKALAPAGGFPRRWFLLLKFRFFLRAPRPVICRQMKIHQDSYHVELNRALYAARNVLTRRNHRA